MGDSVYLCIPFFPFLRCSLNESMNGSNNASWEKKKKDKAEEMFSNQVKMENHDGTLRRRGKYEKDCCPGDGEIIRISSRQEWTKYIEATSTEYTVVVKFTASWCRPCEKINPFLQILSRRSVQTCRFIEVDVDEMDEIASESNVRMMPTFHIYRGGKKRAEMSGIDEKKLENLIQTQC